MRWNFQKIKKRIEQTYGKSSDTFVKKETATPQKTNNKKESGFHIIYEVQELEDLLSKLTIKVTLLLIQKQIL